VAIVEVFELKVLKIKGLKKFMVPLKRPKSHFELQFYCPSDFHQEILLVVCQRLRPESKELVILVVGHVAIATKTKGEILVGTQKGHLAYWKINFVLGLFWIFSSTFSTKFVFLGDGLDIWFGCGLKQLEIF
jgi:hypothetical protein